MRRPVIGVGCHFDSESPYYKVNKSYCEALEGNGATPIMLPHSKEQTLNSFLGKVDGVMLTGGAGAVNKKVTDPTKDLPPLRRQNPVRYNFEKMLIQKSFARGLPIIGICRGHQMIGEVFGGKMCLNIKNCFTNPIEHYQTAAYDKPTHKIEIEKGSRLFDIIRTGELSVNSFHRQCLTSTPKDFIAGAKAPDGVIEEIEHQERFVFGFQFHPEQLFDKDPACNKILKSFVNECANPSDKRQTGKIAESF